MNLKKILNDLFLTFISIGLITAAGCSAGSEENDLPKTEFTMSGDSTGSKTIFLVNNTEGNIIGFSAWPVGGVFGSDTLLGEGQIIKTGQQTAWKLPDYSADQSKYYIQITLEDGTNFILRDVDLNSIPENGQIAVNYKDQTGYLVYKDFENKDIDTYDWEVSQKGQPYDEYIDDSDAIIGIPVDD